MTLKPGDRVRHVEYGWSGKVLRIERYPGTGPKKWATVIWGWAMSARRADPAELTLDQSSPP